MALKTSAAKRLLRVAFQIIRPRRQYEPVEFGGRVYAGKREADDRWRAIAEVIRTYKIGSILDIGCAEGWFLRRAAKEFGCFGLGVEASERRLVVGELARLHDSVDRVAVMKAFLTPEDIGKLPACDLILCLSVVHHVLRHNGLPAAEAFLSALMGRTRRALIFEMGTSEEKALSWSEMLPEMPEGQEAFMRGLLERAGGADIRVLAATPGLRQDASRLLLIAEPAGART